MKKNRNIIGKAIIIVALLIFVLSSGSCTSTRAASGWSGSTVDNGTVYVASPGSIAAINTGSGVAKWETPIAATTTSGGASCGTGSSSSVIYANPVVDNGIVYVGTYSGKIYAYNTDNGNLLWEYPSDGYVQGIIGGLSIYNGVMYFGAIGGVVTALDITNQQVIWQYDTTDTLWASPCLEGDTLYVASYDKNLYALDVVTGKEKWAEPFQAKGPIITAPVFNNGVIYIGSLDRSLYAIDQATGNLIWSFPSESNAGNSPENWFWATPVINNGFIYAPDMDGYVYILDAGTGALISNIDLGSPVSSSPVLLNGKVIVATQEGSIYAIDPGNQSSTLIKSLGLKVISALSGSEGIVYVHTISPEAVYAIDVESHTSIWQHEIS